MTKILNFEEQRHKQELLRKDARTEAMRDSFRKARSPKPDQLQSTRTLLDMFKNKPSGKR